MKRISHAVLPLLAFVFHSAVATQQPERIFADGFESCCRIGGTVSGLTGSGLIVHLDASGAVQDKQISRAGIYDFAAPIPPGTTFALSIVSQPDGQICTLSITGGTMGSSTISNADVHCGSGLKWNQGVWGESWN